MASNFQLLSLIVFFTLSILEPTSSASSIGVCYGLIGNNLPPPREVIDMYKSNHIGLMRLYDPNQEALDALGGSGIKVVVGVKNQDLQQLASSNPAAENWVATYIRPYWPQVQFRYIVVGNEVIPGELAQYVLPAMQNLYNALSNGDLYQHIKVSTSVAMTVLGASYPPSAGTFSEESMVYMVPIVKYMKSIGAPLLANVYPYLAYAENPADISLPYALFTSEKVVVTDGATHYSNLFDTMVDALHASLEKAGVPEVRVVVSETGWPSDGNGDATTPKIAQTYNSNLMKHVVASGTETYLFAMFNENMKPGPAVERHWGLFYPNKSSVYPLEFVGSVEKSEMPVLWNTIWSHRWKALAIVVVVVGLVVLLCICCFCPSQPNK